MQIAWFGVTRKLRFRRAIHRKRKDHRKKDGAAAGKAGRKKFPREHGYGEQKASKQQGGKARYNESKARKETGNRGNWCLSTTRRRGDACLDEEKEEALKGKAGGAPSLSGQCH